ncbi:unnamed protein product [Arabidopsis thaliana]|uniref:(thale cress) hypothetical protein n=1 Tax=Arabidopsis thaliana TaxID=3702 RepID=A0A7G2E546_ARATH|nr:unnamed protein product [Arabidopsis thaliana]
MPITLNCLRTKLAEQSISKISYPFYTPSHVSSLFSLNLDPQTALSFSDWISRIPNFKHNVTSYASLVTLLCSQEIPYEVPKITILMIKSCNSVRDALFVVDFCRTMRKGDSFEIKYKLTPKCYNNLLSSLARFGLVEEMKRLYTEMLEDLVSPDIYTFNTLVNGYCKLGYVVEAKQYVTWLIQAGCDPDYFTYTSFITGHCRRKEVDAAFKVFKEMTQNGCHRNEVSYTQLIYGLFEAKKIDEALSLLVKMKDDNCCPNVRTYTVLIDALCGSGQKSEAMNLFKQMSESGIKPDDCMYTVLIQSFCSGDTLDEASGLLEHMLENGLMPNVITYNALIKGFCKKNVHKAMGLLSKMLEQNLVPDLITYNTLIAGQCSSGNLDSAYRLLSLMEESGLVPNQRTEAAKVVEDMICNGHSPQLEFCKMLICKLCEEGEKERVNSVFEKLLRCGYCDDEIAWKILIDGVLKQGFVEGFCELFQVMETSGCKFSSHTRSMLSKGLQGKD